jgi:hypothetical protein
MVLDDDTDWSEVGELVTESFRVIAPKKLVALVDRPKTFEPSLGGDGPARVPPGLPTAFPDWREGEAPALRATTELTPENALPRIGTPALRALASIGITRLEQVAGRSQAELLSLHGFGPRALRILDEALAERGQSMCP